MNRNNKENENEKNQTPFTSLNIPWSQMSRKQKQNKRKEARKMRKQMKEIKANGQSANPKNNKEWSFVFDKICSYKSQTKTLPTKSLASYSPTKTSSRETTISAPAIIINQNEDNKIENNYLCDRKEKQIECTESCAGSVILEGSVNGKYLSDLRMPKEKPGPFDNGEYEVDRVSVYTANHNYFRTHYTGHKEHTLELRCHLKNCPILVNQGIDRYNQSRPKGSADRYKRKRAVEHNIQKLLKERQIQCRNCGQRVSTEEKLNKHRKYCRLIN